VGVVKSVVSILTIDETDLLSDDKEQRMFEKLGHESLTPVDYRRPKQIAIVISNAANLTTARMACRFLI
jgi:hypothetical protein